MPPEFFFSLVTSVREKDRTAFALSISFQGCTKHYKIDKRQAENGEKLAIEDGPTFDNLMDVNILFHIKLDLIITCT